MMKEIQSLQNKQVKDWKKLHTSKGRSKAKAYLIEGFHLLEEAIQTGQPIQEIMVVDPKSLEKLNLDTSFNSITLISQEVANEISQTETNQGVFAQLKFQPDQAHGLDLNQAKRLILLDGIQDPGNLGTIIRTADAAAFDGIILGQGTVDPYNDKVIRSTQGSLWHLPVIQANLQEMIPAIIHQAFQVYSSELNQASIDYRQIDKEAKLAFVIGNEGQGVSQEISNLCPYRVHIPMPGQAESLNAAIAAAILIFQSIK